jgi:hypothetical protein
MKDTTKKPGPRTKIVIDEDCSDDQLKALLERRKEKRAKEKAKTASERVKYRELLEAYCLGNISRDELPEDGFNFSLAEIFTAVVPRTYKNPANPSETYNPLTAGRTKKPAWVKKLQNEEKASRKTAAQDEDTQEHEEDEYA